MANQRSLLLVGIAAFFLVQNAISAPIQYGTVGETIYQHSVPLISFIIPEDGSDTLIYQYPRSEAGVEKSVLKEGSRVSYEFVKSQQPAGYTVRDKAVNVQSVA